MSHSQRLGRLGILLSTLLIASGLCAQVPQEVLPSFKADQVFDSGQVDHVNVYSGDVQLTIPLGPEYSLGAGVTWRLAASYSNRYWNLYRFNCGDPEWPCYQTPTINHAVVTGRSTLGPGWNVSLGYITGKVSSGPDDPERPRYHAPDGSIHALNEMGGGLWAPDDSLHARFRFETSGGERWSMELPDGSRWLFGQWVSPPTSPNAWDFFDGPYPAGEAKQFLFTGIENPYSASQKLLTVTYRTAVPWQVESISMGARTIQFTWDSFETTAEGTEPARQWPVLSEISFPVGHGQTLLASFDMTDLPIQRANFESRPMTGCGMPSAPGDLRLPYLSSIVVGDQAFSFSYAEGYPGYGGRVLQSVRLPTGGLIEYGYGHDLSSRPCQRGSNQCPSVEDYVFPPVAPEAEEEEPNCAFEALQSYIDSSPTVSSRTETDPVASLTSLTTYRRKSFYESENPPETVPDMERVVRLVVVERPDGNGGRNATKHFFSFNGLGGPTGAELERRLFSGTDVGATAVPHRSIVSCYDSPDPIPVACGVTEAAGDLSSTSDAIPRVSNAWPDRLRREVTWYGENPSAGGFCSDSTALSIACWVRSNDGWNSQAREFSQTTTEIPRSGPSLVLMQSGLYGRRTTTVWTPSESPRWLPKRFSSRTIADLYDAGATVPGPSSVTTVFDFDSTYGKLLSTQVTDGSSSLTRELDYGSTNGPDPIVERQIGAGLVTGTYTTERTFQDGLVLSSKRTAPSDLGWYQYRVVRDSSTGAVTTSFDPNDLASGYTWDALGRLAKIEPPGEEPTRFCYGSWAPGAPTAGAYVLRIRPAPLSCPVARSLVLPTPTEGSGTAEAWVYDGFGRLVREIRLLPNINGNSYLAVRVTTRNDAGIVSSVSEWTPCGSETDLFSCFASGSAHVTAYSAFDVFGRPKSMTLPDGTLIRKRYDDWDGVFTGNLLPSTDTREDTWISNVAGGSSYEVVRRDLLGRTLAAAEPTLETDPPSLGPVTFYRHDIHDQVAEVKQSRTTSPGVSYEQERLFTRNALGFLTSEIQPESGTTAYSDFTALGQPTIKTIGEGSSTLTLTSAYDALGRLLTTSSGGTTLLENKYDEVKDPDDNLLGSSKGKLTTSVGWNAYPSVEFGDFFYPRGSVTDYFTYGGPGGRLSKKRTMLSNGTVSATASWSYNGLGLVEDEAHPRVNPDHSPSLVVKTTYTAGFPTKLAVGAQSIVSSVNYDPGGGLASYTSGNGARTDILADEHRMPRPKRIATSTGSSISGDLFDTGDFSYDGAGNITQMRKAVGGVEIFKDEFAYDAASRLVQAKFGIHAQDYTYDGWGNLTSKAGTAIGVETATNRLSDAGYDFRGNVATLGSESYQYDALGRQVRHDASSSHLSYLLDGAGERLVKAIPPPPHQSGVYVLRREIARIVSQVLDMAPLLPSSPTFADVPASDPDRGWIERLYGTGIVAGCHSGPPRLYCPDATVSRAEMAVFLGSAITAPANIPYSGEIEGQWFNCASGAAGVSIFGDVPASHWACRFIHFIYASHVTAGCDLHALNYCPNGLVDHWEMQVFASGIKEGFGYIPPGSTYSFRSPSGAVLTEFRDTAALRAGGYVAHDYVYLGNRLVATKDATGWKYHVTDHLGSVRLTMGAGGNESRKYWPWGEENGSPGSSVMGFAGMERDLEVTEVTRPRYYDHARNLETGYGRFLSPDMLSGTVADPQSWNRYTYARNNPLKYVDPDGRFVWLAPALVGGGSLAAGGLTVASGGSLLLTAAAGWAAYDLAKPLFGGRSEIGEWVGGLARAKDPHIPRPWRGEPGSTVFTPDGSRTYGPDGFPLTDRDFPHRGETGVGSGDHSHDTGRPSDGSEPKGKDRGKSRLPRPGDPSPAPPESGTQEAPVRKTPCGGPTDKECK